jgi:hypothetical protein
VFDSKIQPSASTYKTSFTAGGCVTYVVEDDVIEVIVPDASGERQGRRELDLYLKTWRAHQTGLELELLD